MSTLTPVRGGGAGGLAAVPEHPGVRHGGPQRAAPHGEVHPGAHALRGELLGAANATQHGVYLLPAAAQQPGAHAASVSPLTRLMPQCLGWVTEVDVATEDTLIPRHTCLYGRPQQSIQRHACPYGAGAPPVRASFWVCATGVLRAYLGALVLTWRAPPPGLLPGVRDGRASRAGPDGKGGEEAEAGGHPVQGVQEHGLCEGHVHLQAGGGAL
eukprot:4582395-Pyramimonas_sp.AAC.2